MDRRLGLIVALALLPALNAHAFTTEFDLGDLFFEDGSIGFFIDGIDSLEFSGWQARAAGDVNGDGIDDLIMGASLASPGGRSLAGRAYVVFGSTAPFYDQFEASSLLTSFGGDGTHGFVVNGRLAFDEAGTSVGAAGDLNGDGIDDIAIGAVNINAYSGHAYVIYGKDQGFAPEIELADLYAANGGDGSVGFVLNGSESHSRTSWSITGVGDLNGDDLDDLAISAPAGSTGQVFVLFGTTQGFSAEFDLSSLLPFNGGDGSAGFVYDGSPQGLPGWSIAHAGDINGDGLDDLVFGAIDGGLGSSGEAFVIYGRNTGFPARMTENQISPPTGFVIAGVSSQDDFGFSVSGAGDINDDGVDDIVIGAPKADVNGNASGQSYVLFGNSQGFAATIGAADLLEVNGGDGVTGFVINGISAFDSSGMSVSGAGDVDGDGVDDLIVGAYQASFDGQFSVGEGYVLFGSNNGFPAELDLANLLASSGGDGTQGFVLRGRTGGVEAGRWVGSPGDINADGLADLIVASPRGDPFLGDAGQTYIVFGRQDADRDGVVDTADNCTDAYNPSQTDVDFDGFGNRCDADFNADCFVNFDDLQDLKDHFFTSMTLFDLDDSGVVNFQDLAIMRSLFFAPPGPTSQSNFCP